MAETLSSQMQTDTYATVGQKAVEASERLNELANAAAIPDTPEMRFINGRTFVRRGSQRKG